MMRNLSKCAIFLLMTATGTAYSAESADAYHLIVRDREGSTLCVRLRIEIGGRSLAERERQTSRRLLRLDATPVTRPYGASLTHALAAALDRDGDGKLSKAELRDADKVLLEKRDTDEDECITPFELVPSLLTVAPPPAPRSVPKWALVPPEQKTETKADREISIRLDDPCPSRQLMHAGGWILDLGTQAAIPPAAKKREKDDDLMTLTVASWPRSWFEVLDANGDGQLSVRELRAAWERLAGAEDRKAGFVMIPDGDSRYLTLTLVHGSRGARGIPLRKRPARDRGPAWFQAMDRNGDGCISLREFIGTREQFRHLDRDDDGLLDPEEAEAPR